MVIVPLPIRSLWPCCFKYMLKTLGFFPSHLPLQEMSMQNLTLLWDAGFFFLFKCFQHLSLMPLYHHKAVKKCSLIIYVLCVEKFFSFIGHHKLPWGGGQKIFLKILCVCVCVCLCFNPFQSGWAFWKHEWVGHDVWGCTSNRMGSAATAGAVIDCHWRLSPEDSPYAFTVLGSGHAWLALPACYLCPPPFTVVPQEKGRVWNVTLGSKRKELLLPTQGLWANYLPPTPPQDWHVDMT